MEFFSLILLWVVGLIPAFTLGIPGALFANREVKRLCRMRKQLALDDRALIDQAGKAALFRTGAAYLVIAVPVLLGMNAVVINFPLGNVLLLASAPGMIAITIWSRYDARSKVKRMLARAEVPEEGPRVTL